MMKHYLLLFLFGLALLLAGCTNVNQGAGNSSSVNLSNSTINSSTCDVSNNCNVSSVSNINKVEVIHFHGTNQCYSCKTVGAYAEETINVYFADELKSGKITFAHINGELPENQELVAKYGVTGSSLWIGVYDDKGFHKEENTNVWYKIGNKESYMTYLKGVLEIKLSGA
jgi:hypothetical protein